MRRLPAQTWDQRIRTLRVHGISRGRRFPPAAGWAYFANQENNPPLPSAEYTELILSGARYWGLPEEYLRELEQIPVG